MARAFGFRRFARGKIACRVNAAPAQRGFKQRGLDQAAVAGAAAPDQRRQNADRRPHAGAEIVERRAAAHALAPRFAGDAHQPAERLQQ